MELIIKAKWGTIFSLVIVIMFWELGPKVGLQTFFFCLFVLFLLT